MAFRKFGKEEISGFTQVKASVARGIRCGSTGGRGRSGCGGCGRLQHCARPPHTQAPLRCPRGHRGMPRLPPTLRLLPPSRTHTHTASIAEQYPWLADSGVLDLLLPKKEPLFVAKT